MIDIIGGFLLLLHFAGTANNISTAFVYMIDGDACMEKSLELNEIIRGEIIQYRSIIITGWKDAEYTEAYEVVFADVERDLDSARCLSGDWSDKPDPKPRGAGFGMEITMKRGQE